MQQYLSRTLQNTDNFFFQQVHSVMKVAEILQSDWNNHFLLSFSSGYITSAEQCFKRSSLWLLAPKTILRDHTKGSACCCMFLQQIVL